MADRISIVKVFTCRQAKLFLKVFALTITAILNFLVKFFFISVAEPEASFFVCAIYLQKYLASDLPDPVLN